MAYDIGPRIGIEGEAEFRKAITDINTTMKTLGTEMKVVSSQFDETDNSQEAMTARSKVLNAQIATQKEALEKLNEGLQQSTEKYGENDSRTQKWQQAVNNATANLNGLEKELGQNEAALEDTGKATQAAGEEFEDAGKKSLTFGDLLKANLLSDAIKAGITALAAGIKKLAEGIAGAATSAAEYADNVSTLAVQTGLSTDAIQGMQYATGLLDVELETQTKAMSKTVKAIGEAASAGQSYIEIADGVTVAIYDANGQLRDSSEVYYDSIDALAGMTNATDREVAAQALFGRSYQDIMPLLNAGSEGLRELTEEAERNGYILSGDALDALNGYQDSLDRLANQKTAFTNAIGVAMAPAMTAFADAATGATTALTQFVNGSIDADEFATQISGIATSIVDTIQTSLPTLLTLGGSVLGALGEGIIGALPSILPAAADLLMTLAQAIIDNLPQLADAAIQIIISMATMLVDNLPKIVEAAMQIIVTLASGIGSALPELIPAMVQAVITIVQGLIDNMPLLLEAALELMLGLAQGLLDAIPQLIAALPEIMDAMIDFFISAIPMIIEAGITLLTALVQALPTIITAIVAALPKIINSILASIDTLVPLLINAGVQLFVALVQNLPAIIVAIVKAVPQIVSSIVAGFAGLAGSMSNVGTNLIKGIWNGISGAAAWLWNKVRGFCSQLVSKIKSFLGIKSPSTVLADSVGKNMALGIGVGFEDEMGTVSKQLSDAIPTNFDTALNAHVNGSLSDGLSSASGGVNLVLNIGTFNNNTDSDIETLADKLAYYTQRKLYGGGKVVNVSV